MTAEKLKAKGGANSEQEAGMASTKCMANMIFASQLSCGSNCLADGWLRKRTSLDITTQEGAMLTTKKVN